MTVPSFASSPSADPAETVMSTSALPASGIRPTSVSMVEVEDARLAVSHFRSRSARAARRVLFVPGFLSFVESWELVLAEIVRTRDVDYFESREKRSSVVRADARFRLDDLGRDLTTTIAHLGLADRGYDLVASSSGVATVLHVWSELRVRPARMVWVAPSLRPIVPWIVVPLAWCLRGPLFGVLRRLAIAWYRRMVNPPTHDAFQHSRFMDVVARADPRKVARAARDIYGRHVPAAHARGVEAPVLVLAASRDASHPFAEIEDVARLLPAGRLEDVRFFWRTRSPAAARRILAFLDEERRDDVFRPGRCDARP